jgi:hypothetical protein
MISFDKDLKTLGFVLALCALAEPSRRRRDAERKLKREQDARERKECRQARRQAQERAKKERAARPPAPPKKPRRRWSDEIYEHYEKHGYWRGSGGGAWTSSKHPDDWEHPHLK